MTKQALDGKSPIHPAPGGPGVEPHWSPAAKSGIGCTPEAEPRLWFTLSRGIVTEIYHPRLDQAAIRDLELLVTGPESYFSEERRNCQTDTRLLAPGVPAYEIHNTCIHDRYRLIKQIIVDPARDVLLQSVEFIPLVGTLTDYRLAVLLSPRLGDQGADNTGWSDTYRQWPMLLAQHGEHGLALASSAGWVRRSVGYVGTSDAWQDVRRHGRMTWQFDRAEHGHICLAGEIDLRQCGGKFLLAVSLAHTPDAAATNAALALTGSFDDARDAYVRQWQGWQENLSALDEGKSAQWVRAGEEQRRRPDHSRPHPASGPAPQDDNLYRTSMMVLRAHRSKYFQGAGVASLTIPWGEARGDDDLGGYHLVWVRDLVEEAFGLLAAGATDEAVSILHYLRVTQLTSGGWPQDMWLDGSANSDGVQLDEAALPILLVDLARRESAINDAQARALWPMVRAAAAFLIKSGPSTGQDRWENTPGLSPYTLATEISGLLVAARLADEFGEQSLGGLFRETADLWNDLLEPWTYVTGTPLAAEVGVEGYYIRIAPSPGMHALLNRGAPPKMKQARDLPVTRVVSPDALALVRFGLRSPSDPRIVDTVKVIDHLTRVDLPAGPSWHRYNGGFYGESDEGAPFTGHGSKEGHGRCWPLLTGERGHYELMAGRAESAGRMLAAMGGFASQIGLLPEQVWDAADIPERNLFRGRPSGSAMPLAWTHSEYVRLLRSLRDGHCFDRPRDSYERYVQRQTPSELALWRFDHQPDAFAARRRLRIELLAPGVVHYSTDGWRRIHELATRDTGIGIHIADLPTQNLKPGENCVFTFRWPKAGNRWEGRDFQLAVDPPRPDSDPRLQADRPRTAATHQPSGAV